MLLKTFMTMGPAPRCGGPDVRLLALSTRSELLGTRSGGWTFRCRDFPCSACWQMNDLDSGVNFRDDAGARSGEPFMPGNGQGRKYGLTARRVRRITPLRCIGNRE